METWIKFKSKSLDKDYWYNRVTNESTMKTKVNYNYNYKLEDDSWQQVMSKKYRKLFFYNITTGKSQWKIPLQNNNCNKSLEWVGNSCYMDSILQSIFGPNNNILKKEILYVNLNSDTRENLCEIKNRVQIQQKLIDINNTIQNISIEKDEVKNVKNLRKELKNCPREEDEQFFGTKMRDSGDFLAYLLSMFPISETATSKITNFATNSEKEYPSKNELVLSSVIKDKKASIIVHINCSDLVVENKYPIKDFLYILEDSKKLDKDNYYIPSEGEGKGKEYNRKITRIDIIDSPVIIFSATRASPSGDYSKTKLIPSDQIELISGKTLYLSAITVYDQNHYYCYFKCNNKWFLYDDTKRERIEQRDIDIDTVSEQGTQYFYT